MIRTFVYSFVVAGACFAGQPPESPTPDNRIVWREPRPMTDSDWVWGPGGEQRAPVAPFQFVKENLGGTNPKVNVRDARGALWIVKFGGEVHTDVFAARLLYATGYAAEPTYFIAQGEIRGVQGLKRAKAYIGRDGRFRNARFKLRDDKKQSYADQYKWTWVDNPFLGTHEMNGLRILAMMASNWDTKDARDGEGSNTAVLLQRNSNSKVYWYALTDWGSTLGSWGGFFKRSRWDSAAYQSQTRDFVKGVDKGTVVWGFQGKHGHDVADGITVEDVRWILPYLSRITRDQMMAGLIASGAAPDTARKFSTAMRSRIEQLERIAAAPGGPTD